MTTTARQHSDRLIGVLQKKHRFILGQVLGKGTFGIVYSARNKETGESIVLKKIKKTSIGDRVLKKEIRMLEFLQPFCSPHFKCLRGVFEDEHYWYIVTESTPEYVTLEALLDENRTFDRQSTIQNLIRGLSILHSKRFVHRDVKPDNIMVHPASGAIRYIDYGISCLDAACSGSDQSGSPLYMAPEIYLPVKGVEKDKSVVHFTQSQYAKADLWAMGMTICEIVRGRHVFTEWKPKYLSTLAGDHPLFALSEQDQLFEIFRRFLEEYEFKNNERVSEWDIETERQFQHMYPNSSVSLSSLLSRDPNKRHL